MKARFGKTGMRSLILGFIVLVTAGGVQAESTQEPPAPPQAQMEPPAPEPSENVQKLLVEARQCLDSEQTEKALQLAERALPLSQQKGESVGVARAQQARGDALVKLQRKVEAVAAYKAAAEAWARAGDGPGQIEALAAAGMHLLDVDSEGGKGFLSQALLLGQDETRRPLAAATALKDACDHLYYVDKYTEAREFCEAALALREKLVPDSLAVAESLFDMGWALMSLDQHGPAQDYFRGAVRIRQRLAPGSPDLAHALMGVAAAAHERADYQTAQEYDLEALKILEAAGPGSEFRKATVLHNMGMMLSELGDFPAAEEYLRRAVEIQAKIDPNSLPPYGTGRDAVYLSRLGDVLSRQGNLDAAEALYHTSLSIAQASGDRFTTAQILNSLGILMDSRGDLSAAREFLEQSIRIVENRQGADFTLSFALTSLGKVALEQGDLASAEDAYRRTLTLLERIYQQGHPRVSAAAVGLGTVYAKKGETTPALDLALQAEQLGRERVLLTVRWLSEREALVYSGVRPSGLDLALTLVAHTQAPDSAAKE